MVAGQIVGQLAGFKMLAAMAAGQGREQVGGFETLVEATKTIDSLEDVPGSRVGFTEGVKERVLENLSGQDQQMESDVADGKINQHLTELNLKEQSGAPKDVDMMSPVRKKVKAICQDTPEGS